MPAQAPGLIAELFSDDSFGTKVKTRIDRQIYFDWQTETPDPAIGPGAYSIRWTGTLNVPQTGDYGFHLAVDGTAKLDVDGNSVLDLPNPTRDGHAPLELTAGAHPIKIEYVNPGNPGRLMLRWDLVDGFKLRGLSRDAYSHNPADAPDAAPAAREWFSDLLCDRDPGKPFREDAPPGMYLAGFELSIPDANGGPHAFRAIYRGPAGEAFGRAIGTPNGGFVRLIAKPGYVVGSIKARSFMHIHAVSLHFDRLNSDGSGILAADAYDSPMVGMKGGRDASVGNEKLVVGIYGTVDNDVTALGLITNE